MNRIDGGKTSVEEFLGYWVDRGGFDYVDGELEAMKKHFGDHCFPIGAVLDNSGVVVVKVASALNKSEQDSIASLHLKAGASVVVILISPATMLCVHRSDDFLERFPAD